MKKKLLYFLNLLLLSSNALILNLEHFVSIGMRFEGGREDKGSYLQFKAKYGRAKLDHHNQIIGAVVPQDL